MNRLAFGHEIVCHSRAASRPPAPPSQRPPQHSVPRYSRRAILQLLCTTSLVSTSAALAASDYDHLPQSEQQWRERLTAAQFYVLREHGTERPFTSPLNDEKRVGTFCCAACQAPLFPSEAKFDSGTGWPSFTFALENRIRVKQSFADRLLLRKEVSCARCAGHLGHVFEDGPAPTGLRYCMNGIALSFSPT